MDHNHLDANSHPLVAMGYFAVCIIFAVLGTAFEVLHSVGLIITWLGIILKTLSYGISAVSGLTWMRKNQDSPDTAWFFSVFKKRIK